MDKNRPDLWPKPIHKSKVLIISVFYSPPPILVGLPRLPEFQMDSEESRWIPVKCRRTSNKRI